LLSSDGITLDLPRAPRLLRRPPRPARVDALPCHRPPYVGLWITQQLRQAFPDDQAPRYLILDRDAKYGSEVLTAIHRLRITPKQITARSPWQNGVAERFVSTARRELLDQVIVLNEKHVQRLPAGFASD
jgi:transposase InsO family protein